MLEFINVSYRRGSEYLVKDATFTIYPGEKVGILGKNGCGKTSFFKLVLGEITEDVGDVNFAKNLSMATLEQESEEIELSALEYVIQADTQVHELNTALEIALEQNDHDKMIKIYQSLDDLDASRIPAKAAQILDGLGFSQEQLSHLVCDFSGGWQVRLKLARTLMRRAQCLLLDEPTNHLDIEAILWLEKYLKTQFKGTLLVIAHDSVFLDRIATNMLVFENQKIEKYTGNYTQVMHLKAEQSRLQKKLYEKQEKVKADMVAFINRFKAKASKAKQAQSRMKALARMEEIAINHVESPLSFEFLNPKEQFNPLISFKQVNIGYDDLEPVLKNVNLTLSPGMRVALVGKNGQGKSTLIKALSRTLEVQSGDTLFTPNLRIGYFAQHRVSQLNLNENAYWHLENMKEQLDTKLNEKQIRTYLGSYDFSGDKVFEPLRTFSGGEKARLILAMIAIVKPHILLLDEPTNHLDLEMKEALSMAMQNYQGAVILVSHDRQLILDTMDELWLVNDGQVLPFEGDLDDYENFVSKSQNTNSNKESKKSVKSEKSNKKNKPQADKNTKVISSTDKNQIKRLETQLQNSLREKVDKEALLTSEEMYLPQNAKKLADTLEELAQIRSKIDQLEEDWLAIMDKTHK